ncbi:prolyl oligopeptidase family serine peptidase [Trichococcus shcherbakoviae]|uniref:Alpha/beta hydrolase fold n=1 Tax=Trichococcus shcherbakoviae TaxID=2094020 RepID=A0A383TGH9_9LACT|nr:prolyl oligopeptidase family serine peptidase [Trichococcus shcherbakoviae]SYZ78561.1 alpha/beta hydrolase fold [Trichococcus shcherbakoviae]
MIVIERKIIHNIPILEIVEEAKKNEAIPLAFFYHGITNQKERGLEPGYALASNGMRVVIPDAYRHGERKDEAYAGEPAAEFWSVVLQSIKELPAIVEVYVEAGLAQKDNVSVTGLSMGGITTCIALTQYPWIHSAACLMGSPDPIGLSHWALKSRWVEGLPPIDDEKVKILMAPFESLSLKEHPESLVDTPFYIWHGTADESVPYDQMAQFVSSISGEAFSDNVCFRSTEGAGHRVPYAIFEEMAAFLGNAY